MSLTLEKLAVDHNYYCHTNNRHCNESSAYFNTAEDFFNEWENADIDYNLIFRWDIKEVDEEDKCSDEKEYYAEVFYIQQGLGNFYPVTIERIEEKDVERFVTLMKKNWKYLKEIWNPLSGETK